MPVGVGVGRTNRVCRGVLFVPCWLWGSVAWEMQPVRLHSLQVGGSAVPAGHGGMQLQRVRCRRGRGIHALGAIY